MNIPPMKNVCVFGYTNTSEPSHRKKYMEE